MKKAEGNLRIYTDGGCSGNPGPGGWAYIMVLKTYQGEEIIARRKGAEKNTTNNRMELLAAIHALRSLKTRKDLPNKATIYTDSQYVQRGITEWIYIWKNNSWKNSDRKPVKNQDLWEELDSLAGNFSIRWQWVQGHAGHKYNEMCDQLTQDAIAAI